MMKKKNPKFIVTDDVKKSTFGARYRVIKVLPPHTEDSTNEKYNNDTDDYKYEIEQQTGEDADKKEIVAESEIKKTLMQIGHVDAAEQKRQASYGQFAGGKRRKTMKKGRKMRRKSMKKGRKMRRRSMKGGNCDGRRQQYGGNWFSSEPKSWDEWANAGKSEAAKELKAAEGTGQYGKVKNAILFARDQLIEKGDLPESAKTWEGGKKKRKGKKSRKMTKKRSRKMKGGKRDCDCH